MGRPSKVREVPWHEPQCWRRRREESCLLSSEELHRVSGGHGVKAKHGAEWRRADRDVFVRSSNSVSGLFRAVAPMGSDGRGNPSRCQRLPLAAALRSSGNNRLFRGHGPTAICDAFDRKTENRRPWLFAHPRIFCGANAATAASVPRTCAGPLHLVWEDVIEPPATPSTPFLDFLPKSHLLRFIVYASGGEQDVMEKVRVFDRLSLSSGWPVGPVCRRPCRR